MSPPYAHAPDAVLRSGSAWPKVGHYLLDQLAANGIGHVFGVPGDYVLRFYDALSRSPLVHIGTTREDTAAFAADGYARCRGLGALAVTYGVGALNTVNAVAGAYAESSPVVVISGAPGVEEQRKDQLLHHRFGPFGRQREIFERITCASAVLDDPFTALRQIDRVVAAALHHSRPVYIELPRDQVDAIGYPYPTDPGPAQQSDPSSLAEALAETLDWLQRADTPAVLAGVEIHRRRLQDHLASFLRRTGLPVAATLTGKSVVGERHPAYLGVYEGALGPDRARRTIESSDLLIMLGVTLNDVDLGVYTACLEPDNIIRAGQNEVWVRHHRYSDVRLGDYIDGLAGMAGPTGAAALSAPDAQTGVDFPQPRSAISTARLAARLNDFLQPDMQIVCDTGDCMFAALDIRVHERSEFLASAFYTTMGFAVPAALGAQVARPQLRPLVLVGDGAFQMTGTELATAARLGLDPIVIVFNNRGYSTERFILDGPFNDIGEWHFHRLGELFGPLLGLHANDEESFDKALLAARDHRQGPSVIDVALQPDDASAAMRRLAAHLSQRISG